MLKNLAVVEYRMTLLIVMLVKRLNALPLNSD